MRHGALTALAALVVGVIPAMNARGQEKAPGATTTSLTVQRDAVQARVLMPGGALIRATTAEVSAARLIRIDNTPVAVATWDESVGADVQPYFAVSLDGEKIDAVSAAQYELKLRHGRVDPLRGADVVATEWVTPADNAMHIVQFVTIPLEVYSKQLQALGAVVRGYLPEYAVIVEASPQALAAISALPYVRTTTPYAVPYRLEAALRDRVAGRAADPGPQRYRIRVFEKGSAQKEALAGRIGALGGTIETLSPGGFMLEATLTRAQLATIVAMNEVEFIDRWTPPQSFMSNVRSVGGANSIESLGGFTGVGVRGEVMDNGCQTSHPDFTGRIVVRGNTNFVAETHGTATFGIVFGSGAGSATARGMIPDAFGFFNDWAYSGTRYDDLAPLVQSPYNCVFQTNSWSYGYATAYTNVSAEMDDAVFDLDLVVLNSQGNSGSQASAEHAWAKNVVGVGGINHENTAGLTDDNWSFAGSTGPAPDGRIKPDLCFWYDWIRTTTSIPASGYTDSFGGTSAACPETAGHFGLFFEMWSEGVFGNPVSGGTVFQERAHGATARAIMINTASQYAFSGAGHDLTRTHQGWGRPDVSRLYTLRNNLFVVDETDILGLLQTRVYTTRITVGQPNHNELKATLIFSDPAASTLASQQRINNMTLKVTSPTGTVYYGNNGLLTGNWSTSGGSPNSVDVVENVFIQNPANGAWTIEVIAAEINQDGHVETPAWDLDYALVVSGGLTGRDCNQNDLPDDCDLDCGAPGCALAGCGLSADCNLNGVVDECETPDCNANDVPDECELDGNDCNADAVPDDCQLAGNDCNANLNPDDCDAAALIASGNVPQDQHPCPGGQAQFDATTPGATGYQWYRNGNELLTNAGSFSGVDGPVLTVNPATAGQEGAYSCVISLGCISASSAAAELDLTAADVQVTLISPSPVQTCASSGTTVAAFEVSVDDATGVSYEWSRDGNVLSDGGNISGATTPRIEVNPATGADVGVYTCAVTNACMIEPATASGELRISASFVQQPPQTLCVEYGSNAVFSAQAANPQPDILRWYEGTTLLNEGGRFSGTATDTLTLSNVQAADNGRQFRLRLIVIDPSCAHYSQYSVLQALPPGECPDCPAPGDMDADGDYDLFDLYRFAQCFGADVTVIDSCACANVVTNNLVVDLEDWAALEAMTLGPN